MNDGSLPRAEPSSLPDGKKNRCAPKKTVSTPNLSACPVMASVFPARALNGCRRIRIRRRLSEEAGRKRSLFPMPKGNSPYDRRGRRRETQWPTSTGRGARQPCEIASAELCVFRQGTRREGGTSRPRLNVYQASKVAFPLPRTRVATVCSTDVGSCERRQHVSLAHPSHSPPREDLVGRSLRRIRE